LGSPASLAPVLTFWFTLPVSSTPVAVIQPEPIVNIGPMRVLVVDDLLISRDFA